LGKRADVHVIIEKGEPCDAFENVKAVYWQRHGLAGRLRRSLELMHLALEIRRQGCRGFFVRIAVPAAIILSFMGRCFDFRVFYWLSGQPTNLLTSAPGWRNSWKRASAYCRLFPARLAMLAAHRVVTGPESMRPYLSRVYRIPQEKIALLYNDIDVRAWQPRDEAARKELKRAYGLPDYRKVITRVGRISEFKGGNYILPLVARVRGNGSGGPIFLSVGEDKMGVTSQAETIGIEESLKLTGKVPNDRVKDYLALSDVFILISNEEGFPRVLLEAMASGLPVVAFDVGGVRDIVAPEQQEFVVPRGDLDAFADRLLTLLADPELRRRQGQISRERVQRFATPVVAEMFVEHLLKD
jgi:glycosyltransferase involved in cell wall biosynthesis